MPGEEPQPPRDLTFLEHLDELRTRLFLCLIALAGTTGASLMVADRLIGWLKQPAGDRLGTLAFFTPTEALTAHLKVAMISGLVCALPVVLYELWAFIRPALRRRERAYALVVVLWGSALFGVGVWAAHRLVLPLFLKVLLSVGEPYLQPVISVGRYVSFTLGVMLACGALCELPLVLLVLVRLGVLTPQGLRRHRPVALLGLLVLAAVVTPTTDAFTMLIAVVPLVILYEAAIVIASWSGSRRASSSDRDRTLIQT